MWLVPRSLLFRIRYSTNGSFLPLKILQSDVWSPFPENYFKILISEIPRHPIQSRNSNFKWCLGRKFKILFNLSRLLAEKGNCASLYSNPLNGTVLRNIFKYFRLPFPLYFPLLPSPLGRTSFSKIKLLSPGFPSWKVSLGLEFYRNITFFRFTSTPFLFSRLQLAFAFQSKLRTKFNSKLVNFHPSPKSNY